MYEAGKNSSFDNVAVMYRPEVGAAFIYDALALWTKGKHSFYAYYPYDDPASDVLPHIMNLNGRPCLQYNQPMTLDTMIDVLTAAALNKTSSDTDAQPVQLTFEHRLFAFDVILNNTQSESARDLRILGASVKFANVCKTGYLYFDNTDDDEYADILSGTEVCDTIRNSFEIEEGLLTIPAPEGESTVVSHNFNETSSFLFLPCVSLEVYFTLDFINAWNEECTFKTSSTITPSTGFLPGHRYALVINMRDNGQSMEFIPSVKEWDTFDDIDIKFE